MDKTLCEWCLVIPKNCPLWTNKYFSIIHSVINWKYKMSFHKKYWDNWYEDICICSIEEIIGHYDLSSVLKYIKYEYLVDLWDYLFLRRADEWDIKIPNKPLNIYSVDEEKELLELLSNLQKYE
jgi:hypothetical protein